MAGCLSDIESDMSAVHRVDDIWSMDGPRFFRLAWRLAAYQGCMRDHAVTAAARLQAQPPPQMAAPQQAQPATRALVGASRELQGIFSFGNGASA
jgi:hypothetical protein